MGISTPQFFGAQTTSSRRILGDPYSKERFGRYFEQRQIAINLLKAATVDRDSTRSVLGYASDDVLYGPDVKDGKVVTSPAGWTDLGGGRYQSDGSGGVNVGPFFSTVLPTGFSCRFSFEIESVTSGGLKCRFGNSFSPSYETTVGVYDVDLTSTTNTVAYLYSDTFIGIVKWTSVKEVTQPSLLTVPADLPAFEGARLATTEADGAVLGSEISGDVDLDDAGYWAKFQSPPNSTTTVEGGTCRLISDGTDCSLYKDFGLTIGKRYKYDVQGVAGLLGSGLVVCGAETLVAISTFDVRGEFIASASNMRIKRNTACDISFSSWSVKEVIPTWYNRETKKDPVTKVACIGDSFTEDTAGGTYILRLDEINPYTHCINFGLAGDDLVEMALRFDADVLSVDSEVVLIQGGINGIAYAASDPLPSMIAARNEMVSKTVTAGRTPIIVGLSPWSGFVAQWTETRQGYTEAYNADTEAYCLANGYTFIDIYTPLADGTALADAYSRDTLHPNLAGYDIIGDLISTGASSVFSSLAVKSIPLPNVSLSIADSGANYLTLSNEFDLWPSAATASATPNTTTGISGEVDADTLNLPANFDYLQHAYGGVQNGETWCASVYLKRNSGTVTMRLQQGNSAQTIRQIIDTSAQTNTDGSIISATRVASGVEPFNSEYDRYWVSGSLTTTGTNIALMFVNEGGSQTGVIATSVQLEQSTAPTPYIATSGATASRDADIATIPTPSVITESWAISGVSSASDPTSTGTIISSYVNADNYTQLLASLAGLTLKKVVAGVSHETYFPFVATTADFEWQIFGDYNAGIGVRAATGAVTNEEFSMHYDAGVAAAFGDTLGVGNLNATSIYAGTLSNNKLVFYKSPQAAKWTDEIVINEIIDLLTAATVSRLSTRGVRAFKSDDVLYGANEAADVSTLSKVEIGGGTVTFNADNTITFDVPIGGRAIATITGVSGEHQLKFSQVVNSGTPTQGSYSIGTAGASPGDEAIEVFGDTTGLGYIRIGIGTSNTATAAANVTMSLVEMRKVTQPSLLTVPADLPAFEGARLATDEWQGSTLTPVPGWAQYMTTYGTNAVTGPDAEGFYKTEHVDNSAGGAIRTSGYVYDLAKKYKFTISGKVEDAGEQHISVRAFDGAAYVPSEATRDYKNVDGEFQASFYLTPQGQSVLFNADYLAAGQSLWLRIDSIEIVEPTFLDYANNNLWKDTVAVGDSFVAGTLSYDTWLLSAARDYRFATWTNEGVAGDRLDQMDTRFATAISGHQAVVIQGGINDVSQGSRNLADMQTSIQSMVAKAAGKNIIIMNCAPGGNLVSWTTSKQTLLEEYNAWLLGYCNTNDIKHIDLYTVLGGGTDSLLPDYEQLAGNVHPNPVGNQAISDALSLGIGSRVPLTDVSLSVADSTINKCQCVKANPTDTTGLTKSGDAAATLTVVDDSAELALAGLDEICTSGNVYKLDNSGGVALAGVTINGETGNTNAHSGGAFARITGGTGQIGWASTGGSEFGAIPSASYTNVFVDGAVPLNTFYKMFVRANAGAVVYFILPGLYESATVPSSAPIIGDDTAATAPSDADVATIDTPTHIISPEQGAIEILCTPDETGQITKYIISSTVTDSVDQLLLYSSATVLNFAKRVSGAFDGGVVQEAYTHTTGTEMRVQLYWDDTLGMGLRAADSSADITALPFAANAGVLPAQFADTFQIGQRNASAYFKASFPQKGITFYKGMNKVYGAELWPVAGLQDAGFSTTAGVTVSSATEFVSTGNGGVQELTFLTVGKTYEFDLSNLVTTASTMQLINSNATTPIIGTGAGKYIFKATDAAVYLRNVGAGTTDLGSVSVKEVNPTWPG